MMEIPLIRLISEFGLRAAAARWTAKPTARSRRQFTCPHRQAVPHPWTCTHDSYDYSALTLGCGNSIIRMTVIGA